MAQSAPNRAIGRQYFGAAYGLLGWTGMSDEARPLVSEIAPVNVERVRFRVVAEGYPGTSLRPVSGRRHRLAMRAHHTGGAVGRAPGQRPADLARLVPIAGEYPALRLLDS